MSGRTEPRPGGAQSIERVAALMRIVCSMNDAGSRLVDLVRRSGLRQPTVRRMLKALIAEGLVAQDEATRRYFLGQTVYEFGLKAARRFKLREICRASLDRIAMETEDTVFLMVRSGAEAVCVDRREGAFPIKAFALDVGDRRPLGIGAGALAIMSRLSDAEVRRIAAAAAARLPEFGVPSVDLLLQLVARTRRLGYALHDARAAPGIKVVGVALCNSGGEPVAAVSVSAIASRWTKARREAVVRLLKHETGLIQSRLL
jgi:DNA-binding IclR family transcriptional regulator